MCNLFLFQILIKTPIFVSLALARASESLLIIGASAFLPIYVENQFMVTPTKAATLSGNSSAQCTHFEIFM